MAAMVSSIWRSILGPMVEISTGGHQTCAAISPADTSAITVTTIANNLPMIIRLREFRI